MRYSPSTDAGWSLGVAACLFLGCGVGKPVAAEPVPAAEVLEFSVNEAEESTAAASVAAADDTVVEAFDWRDDLYGPMVADGQTVHIRAVSAKHHSAAQRCERTCRPGVKNYVGYTFLDIQIGIRLEFTLFGQRSGLFTF